MSVKAKDEKWWKGKGVTDGDVTGLMTRGRPPDDGAPVDAEAQQFRVQPNYAVETSRLIERLKEGKPGDMVTDAELADVCGKPTAVGCSGYGNLQSAIRFCERDGVIWKRITGIGSIKCLTGGETVNYADSTITHVRKSSRRAARRLGTVDTATLTEVERKAHRTKAAQLGTIALFASRRAAKRIEGRTTADPVDMKRMLEFLGNGAPKPDAATGADGES